MTFFPLYMKVLFITSGHSAVRISEMPYFYWAYRWLKLVLYTKEVVEVNNWLVTNEELESYQGESDKERLERLENEIAYFRNKDEEAKVRKEILQEKQKKKLKPTTGFIKLHKSLMMKVRERMFTTAEKAMLFDLIPFCNIETNVITDEEGLPMTQSDIIKLLGYDKKYVQELLGKLVDKSVIIRIQRGKNVFYKLSNEYCG